MGHILTSQEEKQLQRIWEKPSPWNKVYYVNSAHSAASAARYAGQLADNPLTTMREAHANAQAGDRIIVGPGHVEAILATDLTISKDNIEIVGMGKGSTRPKITMGGVVGSQCLLSGEGCSLKNFTLEPALDAITLGLAVTGGGCKLEDILVVEGTAMQFATAIYIAGAGTLVNRVVGYQPTAGATSCINTAAGAIYSRIQNCYIYGDYSAACIDNATGVIPTIAITDNILENLNAVDACIGPCVATSTPMIARNMCRIATDGEVTWIDAGDGSLFENYGVNNDAETGMIIGTASA
jgi:hypothetical protein